MMNTLKLIIFLILFKSVVCAQSTCPRYVNATFPPVTSNQVNYNDFNTYVLPQPNVTGVTILVSWNTIESNTTPGSYNFSTWDANMMHFITSGKIVNLIIKAVDEGGNNHCTPTYVFSKSWANTVGANGPQDVAYCTYYPGSGALVNTHSNIDSANFDITGFPVSYELPIKVAYENFIAAVIQHYSNPGVTVPTIGYIRFGMSAGGEAVALCHGNWPGFTQTAYLKYIKEMMQFIASKNSPMKMLADLNDVSGNLSYADSEAVYAVQYGNMGFGTNGMQKSDITNYPVSASDWVKMFYLYRNQVINGDSIMLSLQTLYTSDPTDSLVTGSLVTLLPFAKQYGANNLELYTCDLLLAYDPNYNSTSCNVQHPGYGSYAAAYVTAINNFMAGCPQVNQQIVENKACENKIVVYPNPSNDILNINTDLQNATAFIYDIQGQLLFQQRIKQARTELNINNFAKGMYIVKVLNENKTIISKFVKE